MPVLEPAIRIGNGRAEVNVGHVLPLGGGRSRLGSSHRDTVRAASVAATISKSADRMGRRVKADIGSSYALRGWILRERGPVGSRNGVIPKSHDGVSVFALRRRAGDLTAIVRRESTPITISGRSKFALGRIS